jgi:hypothetical protein
MSTTTVTSTFPIALDTPAAAPNIMDMDYIQFVHAMRTNTLPEPYKNYDAAKDGVLEIKQDVYSGFYDWAYKNRELLIYITVKELVDISPAIFYPTVNANTGLIEECDSPSNLRKYSVCK